MKFYPTFVFFAVCNISLSLYNLNTNFRINFRSYQLYNVSILIINTLTFYYLEKVNRNGNWFSNERSFLFRNSTEVKPFVKAYSIIEWRRHVNQDLFKTLFKINSVAPRF